VSAPNQGPCHFGHGLVGDGRVVGRLGAGSRKGWGHGSIIMAVHGAGEVNVGPITLNTQRIHPFQVLLAATETGLDRDSKAQAEQVRSVDVERIGAA